LKAGTLTRDDPIIQSHIANSLEFNSAGPIAQLDAKEWFTGYGEKFKGIEQVL
jgi:hypothetical protein